MACRDPGTRRDRGASDRRAGSQGLDAEKHPGRIKQEDDASSSSSDGKDAYAVPAAASISCYEHLTRLMLTNLPTKVSWFL